MCVQVLGFADSNCAIKSFCDAKDNSLSPVGDATCPEASSSPRSTLESAPEFDEQPPLFEVTNEIGVTQVCTSSCHAHHLLSPSGPNNAVTTACEMPKRVPFVRSCFASACCLGCDVCITHRSHMGLWLQNRVLYRRLLKPACECYRRKTAVLVYHRR